MPDLYGFISQVFKTENGIGYKWLYKNKYCFLVLEMKDAFAANYKFLWLEEEILYSSPIDCIENSLLKSSSELMLYCYDTCRLKINEPSRGKTNNVVSDQVRHKSTCTVTEKS